MKFTQVHAGQALGSEASRLELGDALDPTMATLRSVRKAALREMDHLGPGLDDRDARVAEHKWMQDLSAEVAPLTVKLIRTGADPAQVSEATLVRRSPVVMDQSSRGFADQADARVVMMAETDAPDDLVDAAEELVDFFQGVRDRIGSMLSVGRA